MLADGIEDLLAELAHGVVGLELPGDVVGVGVVLGVPAVELGEAVPGLAALDEVAVGEVAAALFVEVDVRGRRQDDLPPAARLV